MPTRQTALNHYKQDIFRHGPALNNALVRCGIGVMSGGSVNNEPRMRLYMKTNVKVVLSVLAFAGLVAAPAVAKTHTQALVYPGYHNGQVVVEGRVVGADPDANIRGQIRRDWDWYKK